MQDPPPAVISRPNALTGYRAKRNFSLTPEPAEGGASSAGALSFVIQKHWASHLHYDFRLELDGTMKSWAVPKGPSLDATVKRMAVEVEDHPIAYAGFEGTIPARQYGAGRVMIWDSGTWRPLADPRAGFRSGHLKFELRGRKLRGKWALIRIKGKGEKQPPWLLIKEKDEYVRPAGEFSVVDELPDSVAALPPPADALATATADGVSAKPGRRRNGAASVARRFPPAATRAKLPALLAPQLATSADRPPADPQEWIYEIKFDGYRLLTRVHGGTVNLFTRGGNDWTAKLAGLQAVIAGLQLPSGWYDGEIVVPGAHGMPDFGALQRSFEATHTDDIVLYLFDIPFFDGNDLRAVPLQARRAVLQRLLAGAPCERLRFSEAFDAPARSLLASACKLGLEGLIAKRRDSPYVSRRSPDWIKLKCGRRQEFVIGGYTDPQGTRAGIGALLLGVHDENGRLHYAGRVGTGFDAHTLLALKGRLAAISAAIRPFANPGRIEGRPHWVKPALVAEVSFADWTRDGHIRHAVFRGLRTDIEAGDVMRENFAAAGTLAGSARATARKAGGRQVHQNAAGPPAGVAVTHPERIIDARSGTTKRELVHYYDQVGALMMDHLKGRPVSLLRAPDGIDGELFFQKHAGTGMLPGIGQLDPALDPSHPPMLSVTSKAGLLSAAQWNVVEFHTLNAVAASFGHPDRIVFDLDPGEGVPWKRVQEAAQLVHAFLTQLGLTSFLKTSGGKGLHLVVPLRRVHDWDTARRFSRAVVTHLANTIPQRFVAKSGPKNRIGKIFIDSLRNSPGASTVAAWSARARPGLGISVPVEWGELKLLTGGDHWTVRSAQSRFDIGNAAWAGYAKAAHSLTAALKQLN